MNISVISTIVLVAFLTCPIHALAEPEDFGVRLSGYALERTRHLVIYNGTYRRIKYPNGDVQAHIGVCTDVIIRSYRRMGIDLQKDVHLDMRANFSHYPKIWGLKKPDTNIDHRRVPNLQALFRRKGVVLPVTRNGSDYKPGDIVTWMLPGNLPHIGIVSNRMSRDGQRPLIVHNIGLGPRLDDMLFSYPVTGHYRYYGNLLKRTRR